MRPPATPATATCPATHGGARHEQSHQVRRANIRKSIDAHRQGNPTGAPLVSRDFAAWVAGEHRAAKVGKKSHHDLDRGHPRVRPAGAPVPHPGGVAGESPARASGEAEAPAGPGERTCPPDGDGRGAVALLPPRAGQQARGVAVADYTGVAIERALRMWDESLESAVSATVGPGTDWAGAERLCDTRADVWCALRWLAGFNRPAAALVVATWHARRPGRARRRPRRPARRRRGA
jgi:hypothetical protein